jgi:hypothetical protein
LSTVGRWSLRVVLAAGLALALLGCSAPQEVETDSSTTGGAGSAAVDADWARLGTSGHVYLQVNVGDKHYELFRADLADGSLHQLTSLPGPFGISNFSVSPGGLVVADASSLSDEAKWLRTDGGLERLPGPRVLGPVVNEQGDVLASIVTRRSEDLAVLRHGDTRWIRVRRDVTGWTAPVWLADDAIAMISIGRKRTTWGRLTVGGRSGPERLIATGAFGPGAVTHHGQPIVMESIGRGPAILWIPGRRPRPLPPRWTSGCVSPDGTRLLLWSARRLGVLDTDHVDGPVREIGTTATRILGCGWVEEKFGP